MSDHSSIEAKSQCPSLRVYRSRIAHAVSRKISLEGHEDTTLKEQISDRPRNGTIQHRIDSSLGIKISKMPPHIAPSTTGLTLQQSSRRLTQPAEAAGLYSSLSAHLPRPRPPFSNTAIVFNISLNSAVRCGLPQKRLK